MSQNNGCVRILLLFYLLWKLVRLEGKGTESESEKGDMTCTPLLNKSSLYIHAWRHDEVLSFRSPFMSQSRDRVLYEVLRVFLTKETIIVSQASVVSERLVWTVCLFRPPGSNFLCNTHIIPVKNEEGVVMMFILSFDYILDDGSMDSLERINHTSPSRPQHSEANN